MKKRSFLTHRMHLLKSRNSIIYYFPCQTFFSSVPDFSKYGTNTVVEFNFSIVRNLKFSKSASHYFTDIYRNFTVLIPE